MCQCKCVRGRAWISGMQNPLFLAALSGALPLLQLLAGIRKPRHDINMVYCVVRLCSPRTSRGWPLLVTQHCLMKASMICGQTSGGCGHPPWWGLWCGRQICSG
jgi:hypothetical protein